jgi:hypothetical protein
VRSLARETDALEAFRTLVDEPLEDLERKFQRYLQKLRPDGRVATGEKVESR